MNLGNKIRELRKRKGITQEQLANVLNLSSQAISKWEMGAGYPDINLIPIIAGYFEVSLDILFDYDVSQIRTRVEDILAQGGRYFWHDFEKAEEIYLNGIEAYPGALELQSELLTLYECHMRNHEHRMELKDKAIAIAEKLLTETNDFLIVCAAKSDLASIYIMNDQYDDAKKLIDSMPDFKPLNFNDKVRTGAFMLCGKDRLECARDWKPYAHQDLFACCDLEGEGYFETGDYENALKSFGESVASIELFLKDGTVSPHAYPIPGTESNHCATVVSMAACLYRLGRLDECEKALQKAYQIAVDAHDPEELKEDPDGCFWAYRTAYHKHGLDEYKPCI